MPSYENQPLDPRSNPLPTIDVAGQLAFVRDMLSRNIFPAGEQKRLEDYVHLVENRNTDKGLYLAVLGEFNSGKSTFINALLRSSLLKAAPKATTAAATIISYGTTFSVTIRFTDGTVVSGSASNFARLAETVKSHTGQKYSYETLQEIIHIATADPGITGLIAQVNITLPAETLQAGTCVIDTPGIGAAEDAAANHEAVTAKVSADLADIAIILIPSESAMSRTLLDFLNVRARRFLHRCIFVVTKMDQIDELDRDSLLEFIDNKLKSVVRRKAIVLQSSAASVLTKKPSDKSLYWEAEFIRLEEILYQELSRNRNLFLAEHLNDLLQTLLAGLHDAITAKTVALNQERAFLDQNSIAALEIVLSNLFQRCKAEIEQEIQDCRLQTMEYAEIFERRSVATVSEMLQQANRGTLTPIVEQNIPSAIAYHQRGYDQACEALFIRFRNKCEQVQRLFTQQFEESYKNLRALGVRIQVAEFPAVSEAIGKGHFSLAVNFLNASRKARERTGQQFGGCLGFLTAPVAGFIGGFIGCSANHATFGSAVAGFLVGGILGVVFSIIGGSFAGGSVGANMGNYEKRVTEVHGLLVPEVIGHCARTRDAWLGQFQHARDAALALLNASVAAHTSEYKGAVTQMQQAHSQRKLALAAESLRAEADSTELLTRRQELDRVRDLLLNL